MHARCALCKTICELRNSHILPEFLYTPIYDSLHRFHLISSDPTKPERFVQKGIREHLLCGPCELKLSKWEGYAKRAFIDAEGIQIKRVKNRLLLQGIDYKVFKLFLVSLLWRMGVSTLDIFKEVRLGPHEEKLRIAILHDDPPDPTQYACVMAGVTINGVYHADWILPPELIKWNGHHLYRLLLNGILFMFFVGKVAPPAPLGILYLNRKNEMAILVEELAKIPFLAEIVRDLGGAMDARKKLR